jgi:hypothetical protein
MPRVRSELQRENWLTSLLLHLTTTAGLERENNKPFYTGAVLLLATMAG